MLADMHCIPCLYIFALTVCVCVIDVCDCSEVSGVFTHHTWHATVRRDDKHATTLTLFKHLSLDVRMESINRVVGVDALVVQTVNTSSP